MEKYNPSWKEVYSLYKLIEDKLRYEREMEAYRDLPVFRQAFTPRPVLLPRTVMRECPDVVGLPVSELTAAFEYAARKAAFIPLACGDYHAGPAANPIEFHVGFSPDGTLNVVMSAGAYQHYGSEGFHYDIHRQARRDRSCIPQFEDDRLALNQPEDIGFRRQRVAFRNRFEDLRRHVYEFRPDGAGLLDMTNVENILKDYSQRVVEVTYDNTRFFDRLPAGDRMRTYMDHFCSRAQALEQYRQGKEFDMAELNQYRLDDAASQQYRKEYLAHDLHLSARERVQAMDPEAVKSSLDRMIDLLRGLYAGPGLACGFSRQAGLRGFSAEDVYEALVRGGVEKVSLTDVERWQEMVARDACTAFEAKLAARLSMKDEPLPHIFSFSDYQADHELAVRKAELSLDRYKDSLTGPDGRIRDIEAGEFIEGFLRFNGSANDIERGKLKAFIIGDLVPEKHLSLYDYDGEMAAAEARLVAKNVRAERDAFLRGEDAPKFGSDGEGLLSRQMYESLLYVVDTENGEKAEQLIRDAGVRYDAKGSLADACCDAARRMYAGGTAEGATATERYRERYKTDLRNASAWYRAHDPRKPKADLGKKNDVKPKI